jgi:hypothetical protein
VSNRKQPAPTLPLARTAAAIRISGRATAIARATLDFIDRRGFGMTGSATDRSSPFPNRDKSLDLNRNQPKKS